MKKTIFIFVLLIIPCLAPAVSVQGNDLMIIRPVQDQLYPADFAPPLFKWSDNSSADSWHIAFVFADGTRIEEQSTFTFWRPNPAVWEAIKAKSMGAKTEATITGHLGGKPISSGTVRLSTSFDPVGAPILYRLTPLPMLKAVKELSSIEWRLGDVSSASLPRTVLTNMWVCGNCHSATADGKILAMDFDFMNDKGSYIITDIEPLTTVDKSALISWSDYKREEGFPTFGLLSRISPDGRYCVSTVKDCSVFEFTEDFAYSQLFFPVRGILVVYDRKNRTFHSLPGANDPDQVQSNPVWSPDGEWVYFCRARVPSMAKDHPEALVRGEKVKPYLEGKEGFRFDIYRVPFNNGKGGTAEAVQGASHNGLSNYFPSFSPDGKWMVFCRAENFMLLQPDSTLWIMPSGGGEAKKLACNHDGSMNSWHSWSPNGKWLVFASKANGPFTELWLTHIDSQGNASPPLNLENFNAPLRAANIPEFLNIHPEALQKIEVERSQ